MPRPAGVLTTSSLRTAQPLAGGYAWATRSSNLERRLRSGRPEPLHRDHVAGGRAEHQEVQAVSEHNDALPGERYDDAPAPPRISRRHGALMIGLAGVCVAGYFAFHNRGEDKKDTGSNRPASISQIATFEPMKAESANLQKPIATPPAAMRQALVQETPPEDPLTKARLAPLVIGNNPPTQRAPVLQAAAGAEAPGQNGESELASKLHATILEGTKATVLRHPEFIVTMGTLIPCTLQTAMDSSAPGIVTCVTQQDVLGSTGSVVLMERGTRIVGEYSSHMVQGQSRMFVLWNRAETPKHVVITLGSPAADAIGQAGFDGEIDTHFWARFGGALMLTFIDGAFSTATTLASKNGEHVAELWRWPECCHRGAAEHHQHPADPA